MKWIALTPMIILLTACGCCASRDVAEYRQVSYTPSVVVATPVYYQPPAYYEPMGIMDEDPIDVTATTIDYY